MPTAIEALQPLAPRSPEPVGRDWVPSLTRVSASFAVGWAARLAGTVVCLALLGLALPVLAGVDRAIFEAVNGAGYGSEWVFALLDPNERLYREILLLAIIVALATQGPWVAVGVAVAVMVAATTSYLGLEAIAVVTDRARPQSVFALVVKPPGADWGQASYPSGHATVTMAMAASAGLALPVLRWPMALLVVVIAWSRVAFGAHFPLDVLAALVLGYVGAVLGVAFACASGLLPARADAR